MANKQPHLRIVGGKDTASPTLERLSDSRGTQREKVLEFEERLDVDCPMVLLGFDRHTGRLLMSVRSEDDAELMSVLNVAIATAVLHDMRGSADGPAETD